jgi:hypothetical protein
MAQGHETHGHGNHGHHGPRVLPADLSAPAIVSVWRTRALIVAALFALISVAFAFLPGGIDHILRAYLLGFMMCFTFAGGGLCVLMLQYVSGGKWGLLLRRPLEAMTRTTPLVILLLVPLLVFGKRIWLWAAYTTQEATDNALANHVINEAQAHSLNWKRPMLSPGSVIVQFAVIFGFMLLWGFFLNKWSLQRDADPNRGSAASYEYWRVRAENMSGIGILIYVILLTVAAIDLIMALDITWYSTVWGFLFLVGQGYAVLALGVHTSIRLSKWEPVATILRQTEQYDLGKFMLGFVMLNIYLAFAQFLIIWSANSPEEIPWYLNRIRGGWWVICSCDFIFHWVIPFCLLLSRDLKYNKRKMLALTGWMIFARCFDLFWLIEPNFPDAAKNLHLSGNFSILAYITVPVAVIALWVAYYLTQLKSRTLVVVNDPHTAEILEPEHAH